MLIKVHYSGGYSGSLNTGSSDLVSLADYINNQFQGDEYSLNCEAIEISFGSKQVQASTPKSLKALLPQKRINQEQKMLQTSKGMKRQKISV